MPKKMRKKYKGYLVYLKIGFFACVVRGFVINEITCSKEFSENKAKKIFAAGFLEEAGGIFRVNKTCFKRLR